MSDGSATPGAADDQGQTNGDFAGRHAAPTVVVVHSLPGRTRLRIPALVQPEAQPAIEDRLSRLQGVESVRLNFTTQGALLHHARDVEAGALRERVADALREHLPPACQGGSADPEGLADGRGDDDGDWHLVELDEVLERLDTDGQSGLGEDEARRRLARYGRNEVEERPPPGTWEYVTRQVATAPTALLAGSAAVSVASGGLADAAGIGGAILLNAAIGAVTEQQSEKTIRMLSRRQDGRVAVCRDGQRRSLSGAQLVPGDLLLLAPGDSVEADARLVSGDALSVDESALTGESLPAEKSADYRCEPDTPLGERRNMVYAGTTVTGGSGRAIVVATAQATEVGRIQQAAEGAVAPETAMQAQLGHLGRQLTVASVAACGAVLAVGALRGGSPMQLVKTAISLGVAAVPEGLPAVATTTLALGVRRMRRKDLLIRNINAVEALGSVQTVCLDKTGTLTENRMAPAAVNAGMRTLRIEEDELLDADGKAIGRLTPELESLLRMLVLCNDSSETEAGSREYEGGATENALLDCAVIAGLDIERVREEQPRLDTRYRTENQPWMYTVHRSTRRGRLLVVKGSPAAVLEMCSRVQYSGKRKRLTDELREKILTENDEWASESLRVLGVAYDQFGEDEEPATEELTWLGLVGVVDPLREGMRSMIRSLHEAGIATVMITGDQMGTAAAIGRQLELSRPGSLRVLDSSELKNLEPELLDALVRRTHVFARVSPANKLQIVQAMQRTGQVVAMTGDGVNDGPALKAADVGVAMGQAANDVARSVADVVVKENRLESVISALAEGRTTYANVRKALHYLIATNLSEIELMLGASVVGLATPLTPMQLLWINLVTDALPALALALEPAEPGIMRAPPRDRDEPIIDRELLRRMLRESGVIAGTALASLGYARLRYGAGPRSGSMAFHTLVTSQLLHALSCRSEGRLFGSDGTGGPNRALLGSIGGSLLLQLAVMTVPTLRRFMAGGRVGFGDLVASTLFGLVPFAANELMKPRDGGRHRRARATPPERNAPEPGEEHAETPASRRTGTDQSDSDRPRTGRGSRT